jgi:biotin-(acetyl-CoA carboxylase) ligase
MQDRYVKVRLLDAPYFLDREYDYSVPEELSDKVTTIEDISGKRVGRDELCERIVSEFLSDVKYGEVVAEYREKSIVIGKRAEMRRISGESFFATVLDITDSGALLVLRDDGEREELISAEVSVILED